MVNDWFVVHAGLLGSTRFPSAARPQPRISATELLILLGCGAAAGAAVGVAKLGLGIPGHSIVLAALPMALGVSLAPRHLAGSIMSTSAVGTAWLLTTAGAATYGSGAFVSLTLIGPMLDLALRKARTGWRVYLALLIAGVATNLLALGSRAASKVIGLDVAGARPFDSWWIEASITYTLSGVVAGLLGACCWFQFRNRGDRTREP